MKTAYRWLIAMLVAVLVGCVSTRPVTWVSAGRLPPPNTDVTISAHTSGMGISQMGGRDQLYIRVLWQTADKQEGWFDVATEGLHEKPQGLLYELFGTSRPALYSHPPVTTNGFIRVHEEGGVQFSRTPFITSAVRDPHSSF